MARGTIIAKTVKDGSRRYECRIRLNGRQKSRTFRRKKLAEAWLDGNAQDVREGTYRELKQATFAQYVQRWSEKYLICEELKPSTLNGYGSILSRHLLPAFGLRPIAAIDTPDITLFRSKLLQTGQSPKTVRNILNLLNRIFADAKVDHYVRQSPMPERHRESDSQSNKGRKEPRGRALQPEEAQQLLGECDEDLRLVVLLGLLAGLRRGEIFALHFEDVDWEKDLIHVQRSVFWRFGRYQKIGKGEPRWVITKPKKMSVRDVDAAPELKDALWTRSMRMQMEGRTGLVFQSVKGTPIEPQNVYDRDFKPAVRRAGLGSLRLHDLRHSFGSWLLDQGEDLIYVSRQMGHSNPSITANIYSHVLREKRPQAAAKMGARLFSEKAAAD